MKGKHLKQVITSFAVLALASGCYMFATPVVAFADSITQLKKTASDAQAAYDEAVLSLEDLDRESEELDAKIAEIEKNAARDRAAADEAAIALYKMGNSRSTALEMMLGAESLDDAIAIWDYYNVVADSWTTKIKHVNEQVERVEQEKEDLYARRSLAVEKLASAEEELYRANGTLAEKQSQVDALLSAADNTALARFSCSLAYSRKVRYCDGYPATKAYEKAWETVFPGDGVPQGRSCDRGVAIPIRLSGWDPDFPRVCKTQFDYLRSSPRWMDLGVWDGRTSSLQPGDVLVSIAGIDGASYEHSAMYVGADIAHQVYEDILKGTDADLGEPGLGDVFSSASYQWGSERGRALCICSDGEVGSHVFRCVHPATTEPVVKDDIANSGQEI